MPRGSKQEFAREVKSILGKVASARKASTLAANAEFTDLSTPIEGALKAKKEADAKGKRTKPVAGAMNQAARAKASELIPLRKAGALSKREQEHPRANTKANDETERARKREEKLRREALAKNNIYHGYMTDIVRRFRVPGYPTYDIPPGLPEPESMAFTGGLVMRFRLTDYFTNCPGRAVLNSQWADLHTWLRLLGFHDVFFDHGAQQYGYSCGVVAARVATWLRNAGDNFMTYDTRGAVSFEVLEQANMVLSANDFELDHP